MVQVLIRHPRTGEEYEVAHADFRHGKHYAGKDGERITFEDAGFRIVSQADGSEYHEPSARHAEPAKAEDKP